jgi:aminoglycoside phosphotransferase (APT) family kinase protein
MITELERMTEALQPGLMATRLHHVLGGHGAACHVLDAKYEPGGKGIVLYRHGDRLVRGDLVIGDDRPKLAIPPRVVAPGLQVSVFPNDADLPSLPTLLDAGQLGSMLGAGRRPSIELLRYRPAKRATVRITSVRMASPLIAKVYHDLTKADAVARESTAAPPMGRKLALAPTIAFVPEWAMVVQRSMTGRALSDLIGLHRGSQAAMAGTRRAAMALAELHDGSLTSTRERSVGKELRRFALRAERIASVDAVTGQALGSLAWRLLELEPTISHGPVGIVHGDCKPSQFLLQPDGRVVLLDLDHCGISDQAGDAGTFVASLRQLAVRHRLTVRHQNAGAARLAQLAELEMAFVQTYLERRSVAVSQSMICWHTAIALERKALRAFARAPQSPLPRALAGEGQQYLDAFVGAAL